ncbi:MAG: response regulator [Deltaproteobacteria bacterium]|nr:response regulator [Deltaproteobacteria bacterium]
MEDDFISRRLLQKYLVSYGVCEIAVNGREAIESFSLAWEESQPYNLICLDIMMPEMDGKEVLRKIRQMETEKGIRERDRVKIIMTSALNDAPNVLEIANLKCNAYLSKPYKKQKLTEKLRKLGFSGPQIL